MTQESPEPGSMAIVDPVTAEEFADYQRAHDVMAMLPPINRAVTAGLTL